MGHNKLPQAGTFLYFNRADHLVAATYLDPSFQTEQKQEVYQSSLTNCAPIAIR